MFSPKIPRGSVHRTYRWMGIANGPLQRPISGGTRELHSRSRFDESFRHMVLASSVDAIGCPMSAQTRHCRSLSPLGTCCRRLSERRSWRWRGAKTPVAESSDGRASVTSAAPTIAVKNYVWCPRNPTSREASTTASTCAVAGPKGGRSA
jgi:hypothetical protein